MNAVLDFPPLPVIDEPREVAAEVVDAAPAAALVTLRDHTMQPLTTVEQGIAALRAEHGSTAYDIKTPAGYRLATLRRAAVRKVRYAVPHIVKEKKAELAGLREQVEEEGARIVELLREIENPHDALIEAEDARKEAIKVEAARVEAARVERHQANITLIRSFSEYAKQPGMTAARIAEGMVALQAQTYPKAAWEEFDVVAANAQCETLEAMRKVHAQAVEREAKEEADRIEAARVEAQRVENERVAAENAREAERLAAAAAEVQRQADALAAAQKVEDERIAALKAEELRLQAIEREAQERHIQDGQAGDPIVPDDPDAAPPMTAEEMGAETVDRDVALNAMERDDLIHAAGAVAMQATAAALDVPAPAPNAVVPCMSLTALNDRLGFRVTEDFLAFIGIKNALPRQYAETQFPAIKAALTAHIQGLK
jgi:hypothetical protein